MLGARRSDADCFCWTFPFQPSLVSNTTDKRCVCPSGKFWLESADCTRSGMQDQNARTACKHAVRIRTSDIARPDRSNSKAERRIRRNARRFACPAYSLAGARMCFLFLWRQAFQTLSWPRHLYPDIRVAGTCGRTKSASCKNHHCPLLSRSLQEFFIDPPATPQRNAPSNLPYKR